MRFSMKLAFFAFTLAASLLPAYGQDDYYKLEGFGGYSYMNLDRGVDLDRFVNSDQNRVNSHGFNGSVTYNFTRYFGAKFDVTLHTHGEDFQGVLTTNPPPPTLPPPGTFKVSQSDYQFMGGVQIKDNRKGGPRFKPFGHALLGGAFQSFTLDQTQPVDVRLFKVDKTDLAAKFGGGIDIRVTKNIDARVIQFDFNPIWRGHTNFGPPFGDVEGVIRTNWLLTFGVAFH